MCEPPPVTPERRSPESEARAEPGEVAAAGLPRGGLAQAEEGVALHRTLPQVLAALGAGQLEHKGVLLLPALRHQEVNTQHTQTHTPLGSHGVCGFET